MADYDDEGMLAASTIAGYIEGPAKKATDDFDSEKAADQVQAGLVGLVGNGVEVAVGLIREFGPGAVGELPDKLIDTDD